MRSFRSTFQAREIALTSSKPSTRGHRSDIDQGSVCPSPMTYLIPSYSSVKWRIWDIKASICTMKGLRLTSQRRGAARWLVISRLTRSPAASQTRSRADISPQKSRNLSDCDTETPAKARNTSKVLSSGDVRALQYKQTHSLLIS